MGALLSKAKSSKSSPTTLEKKPTMSDLAFKHFAGAQTSFKPPLIANENAFLGDIATSEPLDPVAPISSGFYRLEKGTPLVYEYTYHEMKIIVDGEFDIEDQTGQKVHAVKGDVFYFPKGSKITFTTETFGLGFFVGQRKVCGSCR
jgi:ethanolamine utilization protein EutQ (cupin superfamily)